MEGNTTSTLHNGLTRPHTHVYSKLLEMEKNDTASVGQIGTVRKLVEMKKTPTASEGIMQAFTH